ncbi:hypothetical protein [Streptomyces sp. NPDC057557]|uniref:hypothetical protein n=1 Tax=Streptomyces sp. NPDC057557 TaxID=3346167 RepID=UPI00367F4F85
MPVNGRAVSMGVQAALTAATGRSCGYGTAPTAASLPTGATIPYYVLYALGQVTSGPPFGDATADSRVLFQITTVSNAVDQCEFWADKARAALLGRLPRAGWATPIAVTGGVVINRELDKEEGMSVSSGVYSYIQRYVITVTPKTT